jgi:Domain of unknown function (DUF6134)
MIATLIYLLVKKLKKHNWQFKNISPLFMQHHLVIFTLPAAALLLSIFLSAQPIVRHYKIMRKGSEVGWTKVEKQTDSNTTMITMTNDVKIRFIFSYESTAKEISWFRNGKMQHSYYYRKTNGSIKADRHMYLVNDGYEVSESKKEKLNIAPVGYNTLSMYFQEPVGMASVYSDNHQCYLAITKEADGGYSFTSSDGTTNTFYYRGGICYKVKIDHSLYSATMLLN